MIIPELTTRMLRKHARTPLNCPSQAPNRGFDALKAVKCKVIPTFLPGPGTQCAWKSPKDTYLLLQAGGPGVWGFQGCKS